MLVSKKRLSLDVDVQLWVERALDERGLSLYPLTPSVAVEIQPTARLPRRSG